MRVILCLILVVTPLLGQLLLPFHFEKKNDLKLPKNEVPPQVDFTKFTYGKTEAGNNFISGYAPVSATSQSALFFIFYQAKWSDDTNATKVPVVAWLQGGPGGSSQIGNFEEFGPTKIVKDKSGQISEVARDQSWNDKYHILIIDQPIGVGYSIASSTEEIPTNQNQMAVHLFYALTVMFGNALKTYAANDFYIFGESYAGKYVPSIAQYILQHTDEYKFPLKGVGIGDGFTDPINVIAENGLFGYSFGLIDDFERRDVEYSILKAVTQINKKKFRDAGNSFGDIIGRLKVSGGGINEYNYRVFGDYNFDDLETYLNQDEVKAKYGARSVYQNQNFDVYEQFADDFMDTAVPAMIYVLEHLPVLIYNGQDDVIVNTPGVLNYLAKLQWRGQNQFNGAEFTPWTIAQQNVGLVKSVDNLTFVVVNKAGHLVPMDQMSSSFDMLDRFITRSKNWNN